MTLRQTEWRGAVPRAVLVAVIATLVPLPVWANDLKPAPKPKTTQTTQANASIREVAARTAARTELAPARAARASQAPATKESTAFFKSRPGMIALAVMVIGSGYAIYSANHDKINSPGKK